MPANAVEKYVSVIVDVPLGPLTYKAGTVGPVCAGDRVVVPLGPRKCVGVVVDPDAGCTMASQRIKPIIRILNDTVALRAEWLELTRFASEYYLRSWGESALSCLPQFFRRIPLSRHEASLKRLRAIKPVRVKPQDSPDLNADQRQAVQAVLAGTGFQTSVLFGVTGSGKTEVYLHIMEQVLGADPQAQVLLLVPEINLTPQLEQRVRSRFVQETVVTLHSSLSQGKRAAHWLAVHEARARILIGTRMAVFASFEHLSLIIVDEEHDASYKAGDGLHYSARDLAVKRAKDNGIACVLGSATPSLETWNKVQAGFYRLLRLHCRAVQTAQLPAIHLVDLRERRYTVFADEVRSAVDAALARQEQVLFFINRRGYAPVISCTACGWVSRCAHCSSFTVFHKADNRLICHHCATSYSVPVRCPSCGNAEIVPEGTGTQRIEESITEFWPAARVLRIDRDSVSCKGAADAAFESIHAGEVDIIVGTQMIAKGHDFKRVSLVVILNADAQLVSPDIRAEERLFSTLMQVAGRSGRGQTSGTVMVQTRFPEHPLFDALKKQDYEQFAARALEDRQESYAPPFVYQALITAESRFLDRTLQFLERGAQQARGIALPNVRVYDPVPMNLMRLKDVERGQLLVEADTRAQLHSLLNQWKQCVTPETGVSWSIEVDPAAV